MENPELREHLTRIEEKLEEVRSEIALMKRQRAEMAELKDDLTTVAREVYQTAVVELEDVAPFVQPGDFTHLLKRLLRNTNNITRTMEQLESLNTFLGDARPIGNELYFDFLGRLDELNQKGYFEFLRQLSDVLDNVVTHFTEEDMKQLADNVVPLLETLRNLSQPKVIQALDSAATAFQKADTARLEGYTPWRAFKELNSPQMRTWLAWILQFFRDFTIEMQRFDAEGRAKEI